MIFITWGCTDISGLISDLLHGISGMHHASSLTKKLRFQTAQADLLQCLTQHKVGVVRDDYLKIVLQLSFKFFEHDFKNAWTCLVSSMLHHKMAGCPSIAHVFRGFYPWLGRLVSSHGHSETNSKGCGCCCFCCCCCCGAGSCGCYWLLIVKCQLLIIDRRCLLFAFRFENQLQAAVGDMMLKVEFQRPKRKI